ncbi:unnamed protein product [Penicillium nalgiovense]|nr:unnamed protein product [Penicillium nalgiovense]
MFIGPLGLSPRSSSKFPTANQRLCGGCFWKHGRIVYYDYERTSTPAGISPNGNSFQTALLELNRVSIGFQPCSLISRTWLIALTWDTTSQKAIVVTSIREIGWNMIRRCRGIVGADRVFFIACLSKALSNVVVSVVKLL